MKAIVAILKQIGVVALFMWILMAAWTGIRVPIEWPQRCQDVTMATVAVFAYVRLFVALTRNEFD